MIIFSVCSKCYYSISVRLTVILTVEKQTSEYLLSKETNTMHLIQIVQEQHAIYFGYAFFRPFRLILQESKRVKLKPSKCHLACTSVTFLGHRVSSAGDEPDPSNVEKIRTLPIPTSATQVRAFLCLFSYYRRFIRNFAHTAEPLHRLRHKGVPFTWSAQASESFHILK